MFCEKCGKEIKDNEKFCQNCGSEIKRKVTNKEIRSQRSFLNKGFSRKKKGKIIAIIALVIILVIGISQYGSQDELLSFNVQVINNTGIDIYALYASEKNVDNWEENLLRNKVLYDGQRINIEFVITEDNLDWDFAMEDIDGNILEFYGLDFSKCDVDGATLILEYDGNKGEATLY
ncbi:zinc ribbon domain-containing protein [Faecalimonas sp.]